jgi:thiamine biosynthesis protein ThiS
VLTLRELAKAIDRQVPGLGDLLSGDAFNFVVNDEVILHGAWDTPLKSGDRIEVVMAMAGG